MSLFTELKRGNVFRVQLVEFEETLFHHPGTTTFKPQ